MGPPGAGIPDAWGIVPQTLLGEVGVAPDPDPVPLRAYQFPLVGIDGLPATAYAVYLQVWLCPQGGPAALFLWPHGLPGAARVFLVDLSSPMVLCAATREIVSLDSTQTVEWGLTTPATDAGGVYADVFLQVMGWQVLQ